jgi:VWFA-related protein
MKRLLGLFSWCLLFFAPAWAQSGRRPAAEPTPGATPAVEAGENDTVRVVTEEVRLPLFVTDVLGRNEYFLEKDDVMVFEDDVMQEVRSIRRLPPSVLLLLDTNGAMNPAMRTSSTREIALALVKALKPDSQMAVIQAGKKLEVLQNWTTDLERTCQVLKTQLLTGNNARLSEGLLAATQLFAEIPQGARHLVVVTDGAEAPGSKVNFPDLARRLNEANISLHIISYAALGTDELQQRLKGSKIMPPRPTAGDIARQADPSMPTTPPRNQTGSVTFDLDREMRRRRREYIIAMKRGEERLLEMAQETGGKLWSLDNQTPFTDKGLAVARDIGAQYIVTYKPKKPLATARPGEYRKINVALRRPDVVIRTRRGYIAKPRP